MNPRTKLESGDTQTVRAFVSLFRRIGDEFQFSIDGADDSEEVRANLIISDNVNSDGESIISITAINEKNRFDSIKEEVKNMNLDIVTDEVSEEFHESIGEYKAYQLEAKASSNSEDWDVPHLVVYGSLTPAIENAINAVFGSEINYTNIRNHFVLYGEELTPDAKTKLADSVQTSGEFFEGEQRDTVSSINTAEFV